MKTTQAIRNIRLFKNAQNGRPKRVKTIVDDYGNQVHIGRKKNGGNFIKNAGGLHGAKKILKVDGAESSYKGRVPTKSFKQRTVKRHLVSAERRNRLDGSIPGKNGGKDYRKKLYHYAAKDAVNYPKSKNINKYLRETAQQVHGLARKSRKK